MSENVELTIRSLTALPHSHSDGRDRSTVRALSINQDPDVKLYFFAPSQRAHVRQVLPQDLNPAVCRCRTPKGRGGSWSLHFQTSCLSLEKTLLPYT